MQSIDRLIEDIQSQITVRDPEPPSAFEQFEERIGHLIAQRVHLSDEDRRAIARGHYDRTKAVRHVEAWMDSSDRILVLSGGVGCGKTFASGVFVAETGAHWTTAIGLERASTERWSDGSPFNIRASTLVIDDVGTETLSDRWLEAFSLLIDVRQCHGRTLITTNLPHTEWRPRYKARISDRINHVGRFVEMADGSMRRRGRL